MAETLIGTGAELRLPRQQAGETQAPVPVNVKTREVRVEVQVFAELEDGGRHYRIGGTTTRGHVSLTGDPTTALCRIADDARETHLGDLLGDLRIGGMDITRFE